MEVKYAWKSDLETSEEGDKGANSGRVTEVEEEDHHQSDLPTWGLLRIDDKLWLLASELDFVKEESALPARVGDSSMCGDPPDWEGCESIIKIA